MNSGQEESWQFLPKFKAGLPAQEWRPCWSTESTWRRKDEQTTGDSRIREDRGGRLKPVLPLTSLPPYNLTPCNATITLGGMTTLASDLHDTFCDNVRRRRQQLKLTQEELADLVGVHRVRITQTESGTYAPTLDFVERIAVALQTTGARLLREKVSQKSA